MDISPAILPAFMSASSATPFLQHAPAVHTDPAPLFISIVQLRVDVQAGRKIVAVAVDVAAGPDTTTPTLAI